MIDVFARGGGERGVVYYLASESDICSTEEIERNSNIWNFQGNFGDLYILCYF